MPDDPGLDRARRDAQALHVRVQQEAALALAAECTAERDPARLAPRLAQAAATVADAYTAASPVRAQHACKKGCSFCCYQPVRLTPAEAITIAAVLRANLPAEWLARLQTVLEQRTRGLAGLGVADYRKARIPCPFLDGTGACGIHPVRPLACRGVASVDLPGCQTHYVDPEKPQPRLDQLVFVTTNAVQEALRSTCRERGRDATVYELHAAVGRALATADAAARWAAGEDVFADCLTLDAQQ